MLFILVDDEMIGHAGNVIADHARQRFLRGFFPIDWESARYTQPPNDVLYSLYRELEFKTLLARLAPPETPAPVVPDEFLEGSYESYTAATDPPDHRRIAARIDDAAAQERVAVALRGDR